MSSKADGIVGLVYSVALLICGVGIVGWQVYGYLRYNIWTPVSPITVLEWLNIKWALNPNDWIGLYNLLKMIPLSVLMIVYGWITVIGAHNLKEINDGN
jgi:hypothetical protein